MQNVCFVFGFKKMLISSSSSSRTEYLFAVDLFSIIYAKFENDFIPISFSFPDHPDEDAALSLDDGQFQPWQAASGDA